MRRTSTAEEIPDGKVGYFMTEHLTKNRKRCLRKVPGHADQAALELNTS
jgi:hypothetical protein